MTFRQRGTARRWGTELLGAVLVWLTLGSQVLRVARVDASVVDLLLTAAAYLAVGLELAFLMARRRPGRRRDGDR